MKIYEVKTKNGRTFRVAIENKNQEKRFLKKVKENKKKSYELFTSVECIKNGIHNIKDFEVLANTLI